jgi:hypothetical protein
MNVSKKFGRSEMILDTQATQYYYPGIFVLQSAWVRRIDDVLLDT